MNIAYFFWCMVLAQALQLLALAAYSRRNVERLLAKGAVVVEASGVGRLNILLRSGWLLCMVLEVLVLKPELHLTQLAWAGTATAFATALRLAAMRSLGARWTLPTVVLPYTPPITNGIYRYLRHPNWLGVVIEIAAVPLMGSAYFTAVLFSMLEAVLLHSRMRTEEQALRSAQHLRRPAPSANESTAADERIATPPRVCVIGAGAAGLAMACALKRAGIAFNVLEQRERLGGLWTADADSAVSKNTHMVSPKSSQAFSDWPMPTVWADFAHHSLALNYLEHYATHHHLNQHIQYKRTVIKTQRLVDGVFDGWEVTCSDGSTQRYSDLAVASGCHNLPCMPHYPGSFTGQMLHSKHYKSPEQLTGQRVLVVGAGQSAVDILCDAATVGAQVLHSTRRGFMCVPRYVLGKPLEFLQDNPPPVLGIVLSRLPLRITFKVVALISSLVLKVAGKDARQLGLPKYVVKDNPALPTLDQRVYNFYAQGDIQHKGAIQSFAGKRVLFADGTSEEVDVIVCATGFKAAFDFLAPEHLVLKPENPTNNRELALDCQMFHPHDRRLSFIGLVHPIGAHWPVFEAQAKLVASYITARQLGLAGKFELLLGSDERPAINRSASHLSPVRLHVPVVQKHNYLRSLVRALAWLPQAQSLDAEPTRTTSFSPSPNPLSPHSHEH
jgi:cation diffusion facilitator CzcD-associated flavoprotein CzcO/isoprenylcysteine carboxyl methyltransferase (ICMT) family protein YpbQ